MTTTTQQSTQTDNRSAIREDVRQLKEDVRRVKQDVGECATDITHAGANVLEQGAEATLAAGKKIGDTATEAHEALTRHVTKHPTSSVLIAVGVGAMLARLMPRR